MPKIAEATDANRQSGGSLSIYQDVVIWSEEQAALLRRVGAGEQVNDQVDWRNVAEEIESLGQSERRSLASHVRNVLEHLAKLEVSPALDARGGWLDTILRVRSDIDDLLLASPSLRAMLDAVVAEQLPRALKLVASSLALLGETPRVPLYEIRYGVDQVSGDWLPNG